MSFSCEFFSINDLEQEILEDAYPGVSLEIELRKMAVWLRANPTRQKKRYKRFICNWLASIHGRLLEAQVSAEARELIRTAQRRADANVGRYRG